MKKSSATASMSLERLQRVKDLLMAIVWSLMRVVTANRVFGGFTFT